MEYPSFFEQHIQDVISEYRAERDKLDHSTGFVFITDIHIHLNGRASVPLIREIGEHTDVRTVLCGGDHCWAFGSKSQCLADFSDSLHYMDPLRETMELYHARGNHDVTIRSSLELDTGYTMSYEQTQKLFADHMSSPSGIVEGKLYYYHDDCTAKLRYVVLDTNEVQLSEERAWGVRNEMTKAQLSWLANQALTVPADDWSVIVMGHIPCCKELPGYCESLEDLRMILEAFCNKSVCSYRDFTNASGELVAYFCGHNHRDRAAVHEGVLHISTGCDSYCKDDGISRNVGETANTLFDLCLVDMDHRVLKLFRVGAGKNREFSY
jgi:hypothetical protein